MKEDIENRKDSIERLNLNANFFKEKEEKLLKEHEVIIILFLKMYRIISNVLKLYVSILFLMFSNC